MRSAMTYRNIFQYSGGSCRWSAAAATEEATKPYFYARPGNSLGHLRSNSGLRIVASTSSTHPLCKCKGI